MGLQPEVSPLGESMQGCGASVGFGCQEDLGEEGAARWYGDGCGWHWEVSLPWKHFSFMDCKGQGKQNETQIRDIQRQCKSLKTGARNLFSMQWPLPSLLKGKGKKIVSCSLLLDAYLSCWFKCSYVDFLCLSKLFKDYQTSRCLISKLGYVLQFFWSNMAIISGLKIFRDNNRCCQSKVESAHAFEEQAERGITAICVAKIYYGLPSSYTKASKLQKCCNLQS